jgi:hypothetical protein
MKVVNCCALCGLTALFVYFVHLFTISQSENIDFPPHLCVLIRRVLSLFEGISLTGKHVLLFQIRSSDPN